MRIAQDRRKRNADRPKQMKFDKDIIGFNIDIKHKYERGFKIQYTSREENETYNEPREGMGEGNDYESMRIG
jgi:hypothetical protein